MKYDLLTEPWLPALDAQGRPITVGLLDLFARAHALRTLVLETPDVFAGVYRMLLAILHRAYDGPKDLKAWQRIWDARQFDADRTGQYLRQWASRFDLWDAEHPFLQDPRISPEEAQSVARVFAERAQGNNATLFDHSMDDERPTLSAAAAARRLLGTQLMTLGGGMPGTKEKGRDNPLARAAAFLLLGENTFETLALNLVVYDRHRPIPSSGDDGPCWEFDIRGARSRTHRGHLDLMTWRPRRLRLVPGDPLGATVTAVASGGEADRFEAEDARDPFAAYWRTKLGLQQVRVEADRALWRDSVPLLVADDSVAVGPANLSQAATLVASGVLPRSQLLRVCAVGFATTSGQQVKHLGRVETLPVPAPLVRNATVIPVLQRAFKDVDSASDAVERALDDLARWSLSRSEKREPKPADRKALAEATGAMGVFWSEAGAAFPAFLLALAADAPDAAEHWERAVTAAAWRGFDAAEIKLGAASVGLKALTLGRRTLASRLRTLFPPTQHQPEESPA